MKNKSLTLPKPAKIAATQALTELQFTEKQIAGILGIGERSVARYKTEETSESWQEFGANVKKIVSIKEELVASKALALIETKMDRARFFELVGLYKTIRDLQHPKSQGVGLAVSDGEKEYKVLVNYGE